MKCPSYTVKPGEWTQIISTSLVCVHSPEHKLFPQLGLVLLPEWGGDGDKLHYTHWEHIFSYLWWSRASGHLWALPRPSSVPQPCLLCAQQFTMEEHSLLMLSTYNINRLISALVHGHAWTRDFPSILCNPELKQQLLMCVYNNICSSITDGALKAAASEYWHNQD